jgi:hypothetical protein
VFTANPILIVIRLAKHTKPAIGIDSDTAIISAESPDVVNERATGIMIPATRKIKPRIIATKLPVGILRHPFFMILNKYALSSIVP